MGRFVDDTDYLIMNPHDAKTETVVSPLRSGLDGKEMLVLWEDKSDIDFSVFDDCSATRSKWCIEAAVAAIVMSIVLVWVIAAQLLPDDYRPIVTDLAILVPVIIGIGTIGVAITRWYRREVTKLLNERLGPVAQTVQHIDDAVNQRPPGAPTISVQVTQLSNRVDVLARAVEDLSIAGWRRAERIYELSEKAKIAVDKVEELTSLVRSVVEEKEGTEGS